MTGTIFASEWLRGCDEEHGGSGDFVFFDDDGAVMERGTDIEDGLKDLSAHRGIDGNAGSDEWIKGADWLERSESLK